MKPELLTACLTALMHASLLVAGAWIFLLTQRKTSAARRSLTCRLTIAATFLLTGFSFFSARPRETSSSPSMAIAAALPQGPGMPAENFLLASDSPRQPALFNANHISQNSVSQPLAAKVSWQLTPALSQSLLLVWLAGSLAMCLLWLRSLHVRRRVLQNSALALNIAEQAEASSLPGWPLVDEVRLVPSEITPCVWGLRRTILALPASATSWPSDKLHLVLAHECAHLLRRDPLWQVLTHAFLTLLWFHPLAWNLARRSQAADEQAADDTVLRTTPDAPTYAALLVECARHFSLPQLTIVNTHAMATPANLTSRVEAILTPETDRRPADFRSFLAPAVLIASIAATLALCTPAVVIAEVTAPNQPEAQHEIKAPVAEESPEIVSIENATVIADAVLLPKDEQPLGRRVSEFTGSARFSSPRLTIEADRMTYTYNEEHGKKTFLTLSARGTIRIKGLIGSHKISATSEELWISNETGEMAIKGRLEAKLLDNRINGDKAGASITLKSKIFKMEGCTVIGPVGSWDPIPDQPSVESDDLLSGNHSSSEPPQAPAPKEPNTAPAGGPTETPPTTPTAPEPKPDSPPAPSPAPDAPKKPFEWSPISLNGRDFISLSQIKDFYHFPRLKTDESGNYILQSNTMILKVTAGSRELFINNVKLLLAQPVQATETGLLLSRQDLGFIIDPVVRPAYTKWPGKITTVVIDPGHDSDVAGGSGPLVNEAAYTLDTAQRLQKQLEKWGIKVVLTRQDDALVSKEKRTTHADSVQDAIFISLRFRNGPADQHGIQTFYPEATPPLPGPVEDQKQAAYSATCVALATAVHAYNLYQLRSIDEGVRSDAFQNLTRPIRAPTILVDGGNLSHPEEAARIATETYRQQLAESIAGGVRNFRRAITQTEHIPRK